MGMVQHPAESRASQTRPMWGELLQIMIIIILNVKRQASEN